MNIQSGFNPPGRAPGTKGRCQAASLPPHPLPARGLGADEEQVGLWAGCLGWAGPWLGEAQIPQADKASCKHPASGGGAEGRLPDGRRRGETGAQA